MIRIIVIVAYLLPFLADAQTEAVTINGDTIIVYENGTWESKLLAIPDNNLNSTQPRLLSGELVNCSTEKDKITDDLVFSTDLWNSFGKSDSKAWLTGNVRGTTDLTALNLSISTDIGCLSQMKSRGQIRLINDEIIDITFVGKTDCGSYPSGLFLPLTEEELEVGGYESLLRDRMELLSSAPWQVIRIYGTKGYIDFEPAKSKRFASNEFFMNHLKSVSINVWNK